MSGQGEGSVMGQREGSARGVSERGQREGTSIVYSFFY